MRRSAPLRRVLCGAAATMLAACGHAFAATPTPTDSASTAVAAIYAEMLKPQLLDRYGDSTRVAEEYVEGITEAFANGSISPRTRGLVDGISVLQRLANIEGIGIRLDHDVFLRQLLKAMKGEDIGFTSASANEYMERRVQQGPEIDPAFAKAQTDFVAAAAARQGAVTTPSGLVFEVVTEGEGTMPSATDRVKVNYIGKLADGTVFDRTEGNPVTFDVGHLIKGFTEGLQMMKPGGTYKLTIPAEIGYGTRGAGGVIPPGAALEFTVELLGIEP